jgi:hypothetical protein
VESRDLIEADGRGRLDQLLKKAISCRNAFTHGELEAERGRMFLSYFEGTPQRKELSDEYLKDVDDTLKAAVDATRKLAEIP